MKKLSLNKETLRELTDGDLDRAAGGVDTLRCPPLTVRVQTPCCPPSISVPGCVCTGGITC